MSQSTSQISEPAEQTDSSALRSPSDKVLVDKPLRFATSDEWAVVVMSNFTPFLQDHAAAEKKASGMALSMISHYPDRKQLVETMTDLAVEEMSHFREVVKWLHRRGEQLAPDTKDAYILAIRDQIRQGSDYYFLDRLLTAGIIEARGCERFGLVAEAITDDEPLKRFYQAITASEQRHYRELIDLALLYFDEKTVVQRADELLDIEASIVERLPIQAALH